MWTETHFYQLPEAATFATLPQPEQAAIDVIGTVYNTSNPEAPVANPGFHVNARWWAMGTAAEPPAWAPYRRTAPNFPKREFA